MKGKAKYIIGGIILLIIVGIAVGGGSDSDTSNNTNSNSESSESAPAETAKIGTAVRDGKFEFTIASVDCGTTELGDNEFLREEAQGQFCVMDITVKNIGDVAQTFLGSDQLVFNADGQQYKNDTSAEFAINPEGGTFLEEINPGNSVKGQLVFDIPADQTLVKAELHDSSFSDGVEVDLTQ